VRELVSDPFSSEPAPNGTPIIAGTLNLIP
jgi:hypothetical protein